MHVPVMCLSCACHVPVMCLLSTYLRCKLISTAAAMQQGFPKGGLRPAIRNAGGGGGGGGLCVCARRFRPGGEGVLSASGPIRKMGGGGGGGGGCCPFKARYEKRREGGGGGVAVQRFRPDTKSGEGGGAV